MSMLFRVLRAWKCQGTHHKLALDALPLLQGDRIDLWTDLFLRHSDAYLKGSKAPDNEFKDFRNHVLHVAEGGWGGAVGAAEDWYGKTVAALKNRNWQEGAYAAGVLSHYVTDPVMPLHTGQSTAEGNIHRACEWSVSQSYDDLIGRLETSLGGFPTIDGPAGSQWLRGLILNNAALAHAHYEAIVRDYDLEAGVRTPQAGLNDSLQETFARLLGLAAASFAVVLERAIDESQVEPDASPLTLATLLATIQIPIQWVAKKIHDAGERQTVLAMYRELQQTGRIEQTLPEENRTVRELVAREAPRPASSPTAPSPLPASRPAASPVPAAASVPPVSGPPASAPSAATRPSPRGTPKFYLELQDPVVDAPSIGPKTATRLQGIGIQTVRDFLSVPAATIASRLSADNRISLEDLNTWQLQAQLMCQVPGLRGHDIQILVACGITAPAELAAIDPATLRQQAVRFVDTPLARRQMRDPTPPELEEVREWISLARQSRPLRAA